MPRIEATEAAEIADGLVTRLGSIDPSVPLEPFELAEVLLDLSYVVAYLANAARGPRRPHREDITGAAQARREQRARAQLDQARIQDALALHTPCHTTDSAPWADLYGHQLDDGRPDSSDPQFCTSCSYDARRVPWPCPTVLALTEKP